MLQSDASTVDQDAPLTCRSSSYHTRGRPEGAGHLGLGSGLYRIVPKSIRMGRGGVQDTPLYPISVQTFVVVDPLSTPTFLPSWPPLFLFLVWYRSGMVGGDILIKNVKWDPTRSSKLTFSTDITPKRTNWLVIIENMSLEEQDPDNKTNKFWLCSIGRTVLNRIIECDWREEITYKFI